jgi:hypothetical protein
MSTTNVISIIGWSFLVMSWVLPVFIKDKYKREYARIGISGVAMGAFLANLVIMCMR